MPFHAALLRGMNVGGHRITNAELTEEFEALGFGSVSTFRASGNVLFETAGRPEGELIAEIESGLEESLGYAVPTFVRDEDELHAIAGFDPFDLDLVAGSKGKLQVALLRDEPSAADREAALALASDQDLLELTGRELYWLPSGGTLDSELDQKALADLLGLWTMRTKGTIEGMAAKLPARG
jgi:uncharacterized protein (DUF1697 family)